MPLQVPPTPQRHPSWEMSSQYGYTPYNSQYGLPPPQWGQPLGLEPAPSQGSQATVGSPRKARGSDGLYVWDNGLYSGCLLSQECPPECVWSWWRSYHIPGTACMVRFALPANLLAAPLNHSLACAKSFGAVVDTPRIALACTQAPAVAAS